jgi:hypothetical protein
MSFSFNDFTAALKAGAPLSAEDVLAVRREVWPDGRISDGEARALFEIDRLAADPAPEWAEFFLEALCDHVVNGHEPKGYIDLPNAAWLVEEIERGGQPPSGLELELAVRVIERALNGPAELKSWVLARIEEAVLQDGRVDARETGLLRRTIFASGGDGALAVSRDEAELLWRLKHACREADNAPEWKTLFVQGVGNHLMAYNSYKPLERGEAVRLEAFMDDRRSSVLGFFARMRGANPLGEARGLFGGGDSPRADHDAAVADARAISGSENDWLQAHVDSDGVRDAYEEALLAFVAEESGR